MIFDQNCANTINLAKAATAIPDALHYQVVFLAECSQKFAGLLKATLTETTKLQQDWRDQKSWLTSEVRVLAQRSAEAAQVGQGVERVGQTGQALARIAEQVTQITGVVSEIAASAEEQAVGLREVNSAVNQMDQVTQQNAAMVEQATAATHSLREETDALAAMMDKFRTGDGRILAEMGASVNATKAQPSNPPRSGRRPAAAMAGGGRQAAPHDASWEDF